MNNISIETTSDVKDFERILALQSDNFKSALTESEIASQGFVTLQMSMEELNHIRGGYGHVVAKNGLGEVVAYALVMLKSKGLEIPQFAGLFHTMDTLPIFSAGSVSYFILGQICVAKAYRGQGLFDRVYHRLFAEMAKEFDYIATEVAKVNARSLRAHVRMGFEVVREHEEDGEIWCIVQKKLR